jgi:hypothetical protein
MKLRHLAFCLSGLALFGTGATLLFGRPAPTAPQTTKPSPRTDRDKVRAEVITLRTEVEMLRLDYELARDELLDELKMIRGLRTAGELIGIGASVQNAFNQAVANPVDSLPPREAVANPVDSLPPPEAREAPKTSAASAKTVVNAEKEHAPAEAVKAAEKAEKENAAALNAEIAARKKVLSHLFALLEAKRLDLDEAERRYRDLTR